VSIVFLITLVKSSQTGRVYPSKLDHRKNLTKSNEELVYVYKHFRIYGLLKYIGYRLLTFYIIDFKDVT
jgi:hypothetical protein